MPQRNINRTKRKYNRSNGGKWMKETRWICGRNLKNRRIKQTDRTVVLYFHVFTIEIFLFSPVLSGNLSSGANRTITSTMSAMMTFNECDTRSVFKCCMYRSWIYAERIQVARVVGVKTEKWHTTCAVVISTYCVYQHSSIILYKLINTDYQQ